MTPKLPPITAKLLSVFERGQGRLFGWGASNPSLFLGTGAAALTAPLFMKNDDRGYFKTAAMTTPLLISAAMVAPRLIPAARAEGTRLRDVVKQVPTDYGFRDGVYEAATGAVNFHEMEQAYREGRISQKQYMRGQADFYSGLVVRQVTGEQITQEWGALSSHFSQLREDPTKQRLLENAFYHARLKGSGAADKLNWEGLSNIAPAMTHQQMEDAIEANRSNIDWIREMNFRMQQAAKARTAGVGEIVPTLADLATANPNFPTFHRFDQGGKDMLAGAHPDLVDELDSVMRQRKYLKAEHISVVTIPGRNQAINEIVGLRIGEDLNLPIINAHGGVRLGKNWENVGVSRFFMTHNEQIRADIYGIRALHQGNNLHQAIDFAKGELNRAQFVIGRDPLNGNPFSIAETGSPEASLRQQSFYSDQGVFANLAGSFPASKKNDGTWDSLRPEEKVAEIAHQVENQGMTRTTGGTKIDTLERASTRLIDPMGVNNREKESLRIKSMNKSIWADVDEGRGGFARTNYTDLPEFRAHSLQITPSQRALFGDIPEWSAIRDTAHDMMVMQSSLGFENEAMREQAKALSLEAALTKVGFRDRAIGYIAADAGVNQKVAEDMWQRLLPALTNRENYNAMREFGYIGEGARIMNKHIGARAKRVVNYQVHENLLSEDILTGTPFGTDQVLGTNRGAALFAQGHSNRVLDHSITPDGTVLLRVEEEFGTQGLKVHGLGKQTVSRGLDDTLRTGLNPMDRIRRVMNHYFDVTGQGGVVAPEVNSVVLEQFNSAKPNNPIDILQNAFADTVGRLRNEEDLGFLQPHWARLKEKGYSWDGRALVTDTAMLSADDQLAASNYNEAADYLKSALDEVGARVKSKQIAGDRFMQGYVDWSLKNPNGSYLDYLIKRGLPETMSVSDHMAMNHAQRVGITYDALQQMSLGGDHQVAREIMDRLRTEDGSMTGMAWDFLNHTRPGKMDLSKPLGDVISIEAAVGSGLIPKLNTAEGRARLEVGADGNPHWESTIFDPTHPLAQKNFSIKVGDTYVPVLGREAYGGKANAHDLMEYSANTWENQLREVLQIANDKGDGFGTRKPFQEALDGYIASVQQTVGVGKESIWRAPNVDPMGFEGRSTARSSTLQNLDGSVNTFEIGIGKQYLAEMAEDQRAILMGGGRLQAISVRHPINSVVKTFVKFDENLGDWQIGADPIMSRMMRMDFDGDRMSFHLVNSDISKDIMDPNSVQNQMSRFRRVFEGDELDPRAYTHGSITRLFETDADGREIGAIRKFTSKARLKAIKARTAAADVGMLSNTFSLLETSLGHNELFRDPVEKLQFHEFAYDVVREASIAAQKLKGGDAYDDLTTLMGWNSKLRDSLSRENGTKEFVNALELGAAKFGKKIAINDDHRRVFGLTAEEEAAMGGEINPYLEFARRKRDVLERAHRGHSPEVTETHNVLVATRENAANYAGKDLISIFNGQVPQLESMATRGADMSAAALGAANDAATVGEGVFRRGARAAQGLADNAMRSAEEVVHSVRGSGAMKVLGAGAAIAAGAGLLFGSIHSPREGQALSANAFRPEEKSGTDGGIPGEPETGSMAPANPPRRVRAAQQGVRTAVVAPINKTSELEINTRATDRHAAAESSKMAARLAGGSGNQHVNITYRDSTRLDSLRTRDRIREAMDER